MKIRNYQSTDILAIRRLFKRTVLQINAADYTPQQLTAWIGPDNEQVAAAWQKSLAAHTALVAVQADQIVGFADMSASGYLDRLYVDADCQRQGIATTLVAELESQVDCERYTTAASITARPFFESRGYQVVQAQCVVRAGIQMTNYLMAKPG
ncbi:GNAT family N-acetyltransferase [Lactiplantibacillus pingfangensis]|uniref:GNAT family N-acetyltransferase n=1 Tax=Lactiplantibacillus pingfangensis TaxID=2559915 RepID=UPI0010F9D5FA|nr:GNAT family N-acetyltransferase [Lactiplantibacillus pingfangensis]